ncbi:MAG: urease accessory protein UreE [Kiloniellales bacterium]
MPRTITRILGFASEPELAERLHALDHAGRVEILPLEQQDVHRRRLRATTDRGTECLVALPRDQVLGDGAVLVLEDERAIVVRLTEERWLALVPRDAVAALELGYFAGNLHWRVRFDGPRLLIALEGPEDDYLVRLSPFLEDRRARRDDDG